MRITVSILGGEKIDVALSRFAENVRDMRPFWIESFAPRFFADQRENFESFGGKVGGWPPLSPRYAAYKSKVRPGRPLMVFDGWLKTSLTSKGGPIGTIRHERFSVFKPMPTSLLIGTSAPYAKAHQLGTSRLPQRRIIWLNSSQVYGRLAHTWAVKQGAKAGVGKVA